MLNFIVSWNRTTFASPLFFCLSQAFAQSSTCESKWMGSANDTSRLLWLDGHILWEDMKQWAGTHPQLNSLGLTFIRGWDYHFLSKLMSMLRINITLVFLPPKALHSFVHLRDCKKWQSLGTSFLKVGRRLKLANHRHPQWWYVKEDLSTVLG